MPSATSQRCCIGHLIYSHTISNITAMLQWYTYKHTIRSTTAMLQKYTYKHNPQYHSNAAVVHVQTHNPHYHHNAADTRANTIRSITAMVHVQQAISQKYCSCKRTNIQSAIPQQCYSVECPNSNIIRENI